MNLVEFPNQLKDGCMEAARILTERIEAGEVTAFTVVMEHPDGTYSVGGPATLSRLQTAGALLDAAMRRLDRTAP